MSALMVNESVSFNEFKELLEITDGNLASHLRALEDNKIIRVKKSFIGRKPSTNYLVTAAGEKAFKEHLQALENMIKGTK